jgi:hypothetical protein
MDNPRDDIAEQNVPADAPNEPDALSVEVEIEDDLPTIPDLSVWLDPDAEDEPTSEETDPTEAR